MFIINKNIEFWKLYKFLKNLIKYLFLIFYNHVCSCQGSCFVFLYLFFIPVVKILPFQFCEKLWLNLYTWIIISLEKINNIFEVYWHYLFAWHKFNLFFFFPSIYKVWYPSDVTLILQYAFSIIILHISIICYLLKTELKSLIILDTQMLISNFFFCVKQLLKLIKVW